MIQHLGILIDCFYFHSKMTGYATGRLLDYLHQQKYFKLIGINLSRQTNTSIPQQNNFVGKLEEDDDATMFLLLKSSKKYSKLFFNFINCQKTI